MMSAFPIDESVCGQCRVSTYDLLTTTGLLIRSDGGGRLRTVDRKGFALLEFFREKYHHALKMTLIVSVDVSLLLLQLPLNSTDRYIHIISHIIPICTRFFALDICIVPVIFAGELQTLDDGQASSYFQVLYQLQLLQYVT